MNESASNVDQDFLDALVMLHSTEQDSAEELRLMLDARIERKRGREKTLAVRMPKRFSRNVEPAPALPIRTLRKRDLEDPIKTEFRDGDPKIVSPLGADETENVIKDYRTPDVKVFEVDYENCHEDEEDVPRISIPDEGPADGTEFKRETGILLECQECQEAYHLLCHQPLIADVDVYDSRFMWRCGRCSVEAPSSVAPTRIKITGERPVGKAGRDDDTVKENANISGSRTPRGKRDGDLFGVTDLSIKNRSTQSGESPSFAKDLAGVSQRNGSLPLYTYSRKRIGSKLSIK